MIYFDNAATTRPSPKAVGLAKRFLEDDFFNPSALYRGGLNVSGEIKTARDKILKNLGGVNRQVIFTSCGTESDATAIFCAVKRGVFLTEEGEHSAVYKSFCELKRQGKEVVFIPLLKNGGVDTEKLYDYVKNNRVDFVSIMHVNNETGAINDINVIAKTVKSINKNVIFHSDGVQAYGKIPYRLSDDIDLYSISAHKINALKGTGALIKKNSVNISPLIFGGGQEQGVRSGTENVFGIKVFEYAGDEKYAAIQENYAKVSEIKKCISDLLDKDIFYIISDEKSSPYILTVSAIGLKGEVVMHALEEENIIVGNGSACSSHSGNGRVISACGYKKEITDGVIRISFCTDNTIEEGKTLAEKLNSICKRLKGIMR